MSGWRETLNGGLDPSTGTMIDIPIEVVVRLGIDEPLAVGRPVELRAVPRLDDGPRVLPLGVHHAKVAPPLDEADLRAVGRPLQVGFDLDVVGDAFLLEGRVLPPEGARLGLLHAVDVGLPALIADHEERVAVGREDGVAFFLGSVRDLLRLQQFRVHDPEVAPRDEGDLQAVLRERHLLGRGQGASIDLFGRAVPAAGNRQLLGGVVLARPEAIEVEQVAEDERRAVLADARIDHRIVLERRQRPALLALESRIPRG